MVSNYTYIAFLSLAQPYYSLLDNKSEGHNSSNRSLSNNKAGVEIKSILKNSGKAPTKKMSNLKLVDKDGNELKKDIEESKSKKSKFFNNKANDRNGSLSYRSKPIIY